MRWFSCVAVAPLWLAVLPAHRLAAQDSAPVIGAASIQGAEQRPADGGDTLEDLDWMVGDWVLVPEDEDKAGTKPLGSMAMTVRWDEGRAFLIREATLTPPAESGEPVVTLQQRIGWDPLVDRIRSWSFSTDGSRSEATWFQDGDSWIVRGTAVLPDGTQTSSVNIYTFDGEERCTWRNVEPALAADGAPSARATWVRKPRSTAP